MSLPKTNNGTARKRHIALSANENKTCFLFSARYLTSKLEPKLENEDHKSCYHMTLRLGVKLRHEPLVVYRFSGNVMSSITTLCT